MNEKAREFSDRRLPQYRQLPCAECGALMDVTFLWPGRKYRCPTCGWMFRHFRAEAGETQPAGTPSRIGPRILMSVLVVVGMIWLVVLVSSITIAAQRVWLIALGAALATRILIAVLRRISWDSTGISGSVMLCAGLATYLVSLYAESIPPEGNRTLTFCMLAWVAIGAIQLTRLYLYTSLPSPKLVKDEATVAQAEAAPKADGAKDAGAGGGQRANARADGGQREDARADGGQG